MRLFLIYFFSISNSKTTDTESAIFERTIFGISISKSVGAISKEPLKVNAFSEDDEFHSHVFKRFCDPMKSKRSIHRIGRLNRF